LKKKKPSKKNKNGEGHKDHTVKNWERGPKEKGDSDCAMGGKHGKRNSGRRKGEV